MFDDQFDRNTGIGASEAAPAVGMSRYATPLDLYKVKVGEVAPFDGNLHTALGQAVEPVILAQYARETGLTPEVPKKSIRHERHGFMFATPDGLLPDRCVELKFAGFRQLKEWGEPLTDQVPQEYLLQATHQMIVTGRALCDVAVIIDREFRIYRVPLDKELAEIVIEREADFWKRVEARTPPAPSTATEVALMHPRSSALIVQAKPEVVAASKRLAELKEAFKSMEKEIDGLEAVVKGAIGDGDTLLDPETGAYLATWKSTKDSTKFDEDAFSKAHPELYQQFIRAKPGYRRFLLKV
jgi:putative phage-type endonuclease